MGDRSEKKVAETQTRHWWGIQRGSPFPDLTERWGKYYGQVGIDDDNECSKFAMDHGRHCHLGQQKWKY